MINKDQLKDKIEQAGMRVKFVEIPARRPELWLFRGNRPVAPDDTYRIDVETDRNGEYFEINYAPASPGLEIIDVLPAKRHLLLRDPRDGNKLLLGHDETHLFVSGVDSAARNVEDAIVRLAPAELRSAIVGRKKSRKHVFDRATPRYIRQGEWFFVPEPNVEIDETLILHNEPLQRNAQSKPHYCQDMYRSGGETVFLGRKGSEIREYTEEQWKTEKLSDNPAVLTRQAMRDAVVYVRGWVRHEDHKTITLKGWHRVVINAERVDGRRVGFLD